MKRMIMFVLLLLTLGACKTKELMTKETVRTEYRYKTKTDTINTNDTLKIVTTIRDFTSRPQIRKDAKVQRTGIQAKTDSLKVDAKKADILNRPVQLGFLESLKWIVLVGFGFIVLATVYRFCKYIITK